jgi:hypothetical protein
LLFRTVKPGLPELEKADLVQPLRDWREREREGANAVVPPWRTLLTETDKKWGRFPRERVFNVDRAPPPPPLPPPTSPDWTPPTRRGPSLFLLCATRLSQGYCLNFCDSSTVQRCLRPSGR